MSEEAQSTLRALARAFCERLRAEWGDNLVSVVLYGSVARGGCDKNSDIDLLIVAEDLPRRPRDLRYQMLIPVEDALQGEIAALRKKGYHAHLSAVIKRRDEATYHSPLYLDMTEDAILLYDKDGFFAGVLEEMRARMRALGSRRVWLEGGWYWDLKPDYRYGEVFEI